MNVSPWCHSRWKRLADCLGSAVLLIFLAPFMLLIGLAIKLTSRGPVLFRQYRPGKNITPFTILKFRTMFAVAGPALSWADDPRITPLGRFLRKWKLDEIPQLFNVLIGDMSLVGPRPLPPALWDDCPERSAILSVRPGVTGYSSLKFRNEERLFVPLSHLPTADAEAQYRRLVMPKKIEAELDYLRSASFWGDCRIMARTLASVFIPGAAAEELRGIIEIRE